jgi:hypothetical protein
MNTNYYYCWCLRVEFSEESFIVITFAELQGLFGYYY